MQLLNRTVNRCLPSSSSWRQVPVTHLWPATKANRIREVGKQPTRQRSDVATNAVDAGVFQQNGAPAGTDAPYTSTPVYVSFNVYKGKGAMATKVIRPTWEVVGTGARVSRDGVLLLEFASAVAGQQRMYDWGNKVVWGMGVTELSTILANPNANHEFYHDPGKGRQDEGQVTKSMRWSPAPNKDGYFINVSENNKPASIQRSVGVSLTLGEFYTFKVLGDYCIVHLTGFDAAVAYDPGTQ